MVKRQLRTRLSMVKPNLSESIANKQEKQKLYHDGKYKIERNFIFGDKVRIKNMEKIWKQLRRISICE